MQDLKIFIEDLKNDLMEELNDSALDFVTASSYDYTVRQHKKNFCV